jgi:predicted nucleic acid-binding protein
VIVYADSSVLASAYLADEKHHRRAEQLLQDPDMVVVTGTWTRIEVTGALVRAARAGRGDQTMLLNSWEYDTSAEGSISLFSAPQEAVEQDAFDIVVAYGIRAMDAWHLACASLMVPRFASDDVPFAFAPRDKEQAAVAEARGFQII